MKKYSNYGSSFKCLKCEQYYSGIKAAIRHSLTLKHYKFKLTKFNIYFTLENVKNTELLKGWLND